MLSLPLVLALIAADPPAAPGWLAADERHRRRGFEASPP